MKACPLLFVEGEYIEMTGKKSILRFFIVYFCVLLPLLGTSILITQNFIDKAQREEQNNLSEQLNETIDLINNCFWDYRSKAVVLFQNKEFTSNLGLASATSVNNAARWLSSLRMFDGSENQISLYYGEDILYTSDGIETTDTFFGGRLGCTGESKDDAIAVINSDQYAIRVLRGRTGFEYLLFHIPVGKDIYGYARSMEVIMGLSQLGKILETNLSDEGLLLQLSVGEENGYFVHTKQGYSLISAEEFENIRSDYQNKYFEGEGADPHFTLRVWYDGDVQLAEFYKLRNINLLLLMVGLLLSAGLSFVLSVIRFSHLNELINNIAHKKTTVNEKKHWTRSEFDYIQMALDESIKESISVKKNGLFYRKVLFEQVAILIFHGLLRDRKEIQSVLKVCGTELLEEYFFVYGLKVDTQEQLEQLDELLRGDIHYVVNDGSKKYIFILCELSFFDYDMSKRYELSSKLQLILKDAGIDCSKIVMSQVYNRISMTNYAYLEALSVLESNLDRKTQIMCWEEWIRRNGKVGIWSDNAQLKYFRDAVKQKREQEAVEVLRQTLQQENEKEKRRHLCYMFLQSLMLEMDLSGEEEENQQLVYEMNDIDVNDEQRFIEGVSNVLHWYCEHKDTSNEFDRVIQFVKENYTNYELSLIMVAEYAGLSKSKTSRLFKVYTGEAYIDYVTRLRMEKVKELLEQTDISVKEIFLQVGYLDITNASKKFKAYFQINPSAYRAQKRKESEEKNE